jgi:phytoene/squalene synthetase
MARHTFPTDLLEIQTAWYATYRRLAESQDGGAGAAAHRRRLLTLSARIAAHPYWETPAGTPAARVALKELARGLAAGS